MSAKPILESSELSFCIVIPMYNEATGAEKCVRSVFSVLATLPYRTSLVVVNDDSTDGTGRILKQLISVFDNLYVLTHNKNLGYGGALKSGAQEAAKMGFDYVLFMDSDLTNDPKYLPLFVDKMKEGYDVIKASRYIKGGGVSGVPAWKVFVSTIGNRMTKILYGLPISDCTNGFRAVKTRIFNRMHLRENGFAIIMEELYQAKLLTKTFCEVPYTLGVRTELAGSSNFMYNTKVFYDYLKYPIRSFLNIVPSQIDKGVRI